MITDSLERLSCYRGFHENLDTAIDYILSHDLSALPNGKNIIDGENVFINAMDVDLRAPEEAEYEYHQIYADLQINTEGAEYWEYASGGEKKGDYDAQWDIGFADCNITASGCLGKNRFAIFLPEEFHKPTLVNGSCRRVHKTVVKVKMI